MKDSSIKPNYRRKKHKGPRAVISRDEIKKAVDEYLKNGGKITKIDDKICSTSLNFPGESADFLINAQYNFPIF